LNSQSPTQYAPTLNITKLTTLR